MTEESQAMVKKVGFIGLGGVILLAFGMVALIYTLAMAQLLKDETGYFQDCLDRRGSRSQKNVADFLVKI